MRIGHPSDRRLLRWLDGQDDSLDRHVATCERCAATLERLAHGSSGDTSLRSALLDLLAPPDELPSRLRGGIDDRLRDREDLTLISELFGLPLRAARLMSSTSEGDT